SSRAIGAESWTWAFLPSPTGGGWPEGPGGGHGISERAWFAKHHRQSASVNPSTLSRPFRPPSPGGARRPGDSPYLRTCTASPASLRLFLPPFGFEHEPTR